MKLPIATTSIFPDKKNKETEPYTSPKIISYSEDEIIVLIGPAKTCGSETLGTPPFGNAYGYRHGRGRKH